jgi:hypothetical protein
MRTTYAKKTNANNSAEIASDRSTMANEAGFRDHPGESSLGSQAYAPAACGKPVPHLDGAPRPI